MKIAGFQKNSFVDYPGNIAAVVFTPGCNMKCYYCHNKELLGSKAADNLIPESDVFDHLHKRMNFLDAVVVTGGEPTLQPDLEEFLTRVKALGYAVKLDSNGTNPEIIKKLMDKKLVDYIAMDIKASFEKYEEICGTEVSIERINESIDLLMQGVVQYEFRTTFVTRLKEEDILSIAGRIKGAKRYILQQVQFKSELVLAEERYSSNFIRSVAERIKGTVEFCDIRGLSAVHEDGQSVYEMKKVD